MRFQGAVGYANDEETAPGVWTEEITEKNYYGEVLMLARRLEDSAQVPATLNTDVTAQNRISIVADVYAYENFAKMRYVRWSGSPWTVTFVEVQRPRLILSIGGLWNGETAPAPVAP
jgi:hypothetical protein